MEYLKIKNDLNISSLIIGNNFDYQLNLKQLIEPKKKISFQLLFRMTRDGDDFKKFHELCDNQGPTVTLFQLEDNNILGFFTPLNWNTSSNWISDPRMFHFSLNKNIKSMKSKNNQRGMFCHPSYGPCSDFFMIWNGVTMKKPCIDPFAQSYDNCENLYPGKQKDRYNCLELEVFKIIN